MTHRRPGVTRLAGGILFAAAVAAPALTGPVAPAAQGVSGLDVFRMNCDGCHELPDPDEPKRTRAEWQTILQKMVKDKGASLNQQEFTAVLNYLDSFNQERRQVSWNDRPAVSHKFALEAAMIGKLPDPWVNLTPGASVDSLWAVQGDAAAKTCYLAPLDGVAENQTQLLLDNSGLLTAGTVSARLRLAGGKGPQGAGFVFGFRNPLSYYGVRISSTSRDVVLYDVEQGERALLGKAPLVLPPGQWAAVALNLTAKQVQVSVNGKPALTRPLANYRGGRVGLAADGPTIAWFDEWAVAVTR